MFTRDRLLAAAMASSVLTACSGASSAPPPSSPPPAAACEEQPAAQETITVKNALGTIEGTLVLPAACGPRPVALIIAGSGPTDRDGNQAGGGLGAQPYKLLADALAARGVGTLRYDKAGIGKSAKAAPAESEMRFEMGADDAALFVTALRADPRVGLVTIVGHSEGSLLGMLAAARAPVDGYVSLAGAGRPIGLVLREQLAKNLADATLLAQANAIIDSLERGQTVDAVPTSLSALFRPSVQRYLISWMKYDPAAEIAKLATPRVLVAQGTTDIQVDVDDAKKLAAARPDATLLLLDGMNHVLKAADGATGAAQKEAYTSPSLPVVPELVSALASFAVARP